MRKIRVSKNGKNYLVNAVGWEDGIGPGAPPGTLWMISTDGKWYSVNISGSSSSAKLFVSQSALSWQPPGPDFGYQLLQGDDGKSYFVYLSGSSPSIVISQSAYTGSATSKPNLLLQSSADGNFYVVGLHNNSGQISASVNSSYISASWVYQSGIY